MELLEIDGISLRGQTFGASTKTGRYSMPSRRGENLMLPGRSGTVFTKNRPYEEGVGALALWAVGGEVLPRVAATNLAFNPSVETNTSGWAGGTAATLSREAVGTAIEGSYVARSTITAVPTTAVNNMQIMTGASAIDAAPGQSIGMRLSLRRSADTSRTAIIRLRGYLGNTLVGAVLSTQTISLSTGWTEYVIEGVLAEGMDGFGLQILVQPPYSDWAVGSYIEADGLAAWVGAPLGSYFSGATPDTAHLRYDWTGTANNSISTVSILNELSIPATHALRRQAFENNIQSLMRLFTRGHKLSLIRAAQPDGTIRRAYVEWREWSEPEVMAGGTRAEWAIAYTIPAVWWEDENLTSQGGSGTVDLTSFSGMTGVIDDAVITVTGSATAPKLTDMETGAYVQYTGSLSAGQQWVIDVKNATSTVSGSSVMTYTIHSGGYRLLTIPNCFGSTNTPRLSLSGGGSFSVSARRKWVNG